MMYDHADHVGNAGDVWKHLLLAETADYLLSRGLSIYAETHAGAPFYRVTGPGEWQGGVGRFQPIFGDLSGFPYFKVLADGNPGGLVCYLGSAAMVLELARRQGSDLLAELWDTDPKVAESWAVCPTTTSRIAFHLGDGFSGVRALLSRAGSGLLLIDSPFTEVDDVLKSEALFFAAVKAGWTVLCWYMIGLKEQPRPACMHRVYAVNFREVGMDAGRWEGAAMAVSGDEGLQEYLRGRAEEILQILTRKSF
jgi:23S rRNA (adenine2030-N6)-methyltransferase